MIFSHESRRSVQQADRFLNSADSLRTTPQHIIGMSIVSHFESDSQSKRIIYLPLLCIIVFVSLLPFSAAALQLQERGGKIIAQAKLPEWKGAMKTYVLPDGDVLVAGIAKGYKVKLLRYDRDLKEKWESEGIFGQKTRIRGKMRSLVDLKNVYIGTETLTVLAEVPGGDDTREIHAVQIDIGTGEKLNDILVHSLDEEKLQAYTQSEISKYCHFSASADKSKMLLWYLRKTENSERQIAAAVVVDKQLNVVVSHKTIEFAAGSYAARLRNILVDNEGRIYVIAQLNGRLFTWRYLLDGTSQALQTTFFDKRPLSTVRDGVGDEHNIADYRETTAKELRAFVNSSGLLLVAATYLHFDNYAIAGDDAIRGFGLTSLNFDDNKPVFTRYELNQKMPVGDFKEQFRHLLFDEHSQTTLALLEYPEQFDPSYGTLSAVAGYKAGWMPKTGSALVLAFDFSGNLKWQRWMENTLPAFTKTIPDTQIAAFLSSRSSVQLFYERGSDLRFEELWLSDGKILNHRSSYQLLKFDDAPFVPLLTQRLDDSTSLQATLTKQKRRRYTSYQGVIYVVQVAR